MNIYLSRSVKIFIALTIAAVITAVFLFVKLKKDTKQNKQPDQQPAVTDITKKEKSINESITAPVVNANNIDEKVVDSLTAPIKKP